MKSNSYLHDSKYAISEEFSSYLITPETSYKTRILYKIDEFEEMLDSSDINTEIYQQLCDKIEKNYQEYDGFVVLQGIRTVTYTASAVSFMLENLEKPVIFTGISLRNRLFHRYIV